MDQLEARLRTDPTGDPRHVPGQFFDRVVDTAVVRRRARPATVALRPIGALLAVGLILATALLLRPAITVPGATPTPSPSVLPTITPGQLQSVVEGWLASASPGEQPALSVTIDTRGAVTSYGARTAPVDQPSAATARIGEISRLYLAAAVVLIDDCSQAVGAFSCAKPIFPSTLRLGDPISRWYPGWPAADPTTIRQLLEGSSGLAPIAADLADLSTQIATAPGTDWSRPAVLARSIAAPRRFAPGARREPVDTEWLLLEDIVELATGLPSRSVIPTGGVAPPFGTSFADQAMLLPMPGARAGPGQLDDLDPTVLALVGNAGGMAGSSEDLAGFARVLANPADVLNQGIAATLTDVANGRANPLGAVAACPCDGDIRLVVLQLGGAVHWSTAIAYDFQSGTGLGIVVGRQMPQSDLQTLVQALLALP